MHENRETSGAPRPERERGRSAKAQSQKADAHALEESDRTILSMNQTNKEERSSAEPGEKRVRAKENIVQPNTNPTQSGERVSQGLDGVREAAKKRRQERFTALLHHVSVDLLRDSYYALKRQAAPGVDGVTWQEYETGLESRLADLHNRVHRGAYRAQPSRRVYIPKADGRKRPLGIAALEDKNRTASRGDYPQPDLRGGLPRILVWVPSRTQPAPSAGRADDGHPKEACELGA